MKYLLKPAKVKPAQKLSKKQRHRHHARRLNAQKRA
jgi:hypothetical protein